MFACTVGLIKGFTPGVFDGKKVDVWYTLPLNFKLQDDVPDIEEFDAVAIDSIGYQEMMDSGALAILSRIYSEKKGDTAKAEMYMKMAEEADPERIELPKWLE